MTWRLTTTDPSIVWVPALLLAVLVPLSVWATVYAEHAAETQLKTAATVVATSAARTFQRVFDTHSNFYIQPSLMIQAQPKWQDFQASFALLYPTLVQVNNSTEVG